MKIQNILLPGCRNDIDKEMYYRAGGAVTPYAKSSVMLTEGADAEFNTYFNMLSVTKYKKYTDLKNWELHLFLRGRGICCLRGWAHAWVDLDSVMFDFAEEQELIVKIPDDKSVTNIWFTLTSTSGNCILSSGFYSAEMQEDHLSDVNLAIDICTFKREEYLRRNVDLIKKCFLDNPDSELFNHLQVFIQDNAKTLSESEFDHDKIHLVHNRNVGGCGGFTRGMLEILDDRKFHATHILIMDDDVLVFPEAVFRTYMLLKCRNAQYKDAFVGGAMLRMDKKTIQHEAGAFVVNGCVCPNKNGVSLTSFEQCLENDDQERSDYHAWWYCVVPVDCIRPDNFPLPIFIRGDDMEYGLRNMNQLMQLNGICVWHETFESKYSAILYYYALSRNLLYLQALHKIVGSRLVYAKYLTGLVLREIVYCRYNNVRLIFQGLNDFFKGADFLIETDPEILHKKVMTMGYHPVAVSDEVSAILNNELKKSLCRKDRSVFHKLWRWITLNGLLLPSKKTFSLHSIIEKGYSEYKKVHSKSVMKNFQPVVSIDKCRPVNFYRGKKFINYDQVNHTYFLTEKSFFSAVWYILLLTWHIVWILLFYERACARFRRDYKVLVTGKFWKRYLKLSDI